MSSSESERDAQPFLTARQRLHPIELPIDPSDDELARDWTLTPRDQELILRARGEPSRRWCALQLCTLRKTGRFLDDLESLPPRMLSYLNRQLGFQPVLFVGTLHRDTEIDQARKIREHLGYRSFDSATEERLTNWLASMALTGLSGLELFRRAEEVLRVWQVALPGPSTLERLVGSAVASSQLGLFANVSQRLTPEHRQAIDGLLQVAEGESRSSLFHFKQYPGKPTAADMVLHLSYCRELLAFNLHQVDWSQVRPEHIRGISELARRYDVWTLRRFKEKKYALVACLLLETQKTLLDQAVGMHDRYLIDMHRKSRNDLESQHRKVRRRLRKGVDTLIVAVELLLAHGDADEVFSRLSQSAIKEAVDDCSEFRRLEDFGYLEKLGNRYSHFRQYLPDFFRLPFEARPGAEPLLAAIQLVRRLDAGSTRELPSDAPCDFVPAGWRSAVILPEAPDRRLWELALAQAVRDGLRSGDLFLPQSRQHVSFSDMMYESGQWKQDRETAYAELEARPKTPPPGDLTERGRLLM